MSNDCFYSESGETFSTDGWSTPRSYSNDFAPLPNESGVYFIVVRDWSSAKKTIVYVGSSKNLAKRCERHPMITKIESHIRSQFEDAVVYFCQCNNYLEREKSLIRATQARYNRQWR